MTDKTTEEKKQFKIDSVKPKPKKEHFNQIAEPAGNLMPRTAAGLVYNPETISYRDFMKMEDDGQIKAVLTVVKAPLINARWKILCPKSKKIQQFTTELLEPIWLDLITSLLNAINFGFQAFEKVYKTNNEGFMIFKKFIDVHPDTIDLHLTKEFDFDGFGQSTSKGIVRVPKEKAALFNIDQRFNNPYGRSRLRSAYFYWFIDQYTYDFENIYLERYAQPILLGKAPTGRTPTSATASEDNISLMAGIIKQIKNSSAAVIPSDSDPKTKDPKWTLEMLEATRRGGDFLARHDQLDTMKARAIFAPDLIFSAPKSGASYALAKEHADVFIAAEESILMDIKNFVNIQIIPQAIQLNFGKNAPMPKWEFETISKHLKDQLVRIVMQMMGKDKIEIDVEWLESTLGMKFKKAPIQVEKEKEVTEHDP